MQDLTCSFFVCGQKQLDMEFSTMRNGTLRSFLLPMGVCKRFGGPVEAFDSIGDASYGAGKSENKFRFPDSRTKSRHFPVPALTTAT